MAAADNFALCCTHLLDLKLPEKGWRKEDPGEEVGTGERGVATSLIGSVVAQNTDNPWTSGRIDAKQGHSSL